MLSHAKRTDLGKPIVLLGAVQRRGKPGGRGRRPYRRGGKLSSADRKAIRATRGT